MELNSQVIFIRIAIELAVPGNEDDAPFSLQVDKCKLRGVLILNLNEMMGLYF